MAKTRKLQPVQTLTEKKDTYAMLCGNRKRAVKYGFYIESIHISYAILEDRTRSFFYHLGYLQSREVYCKCANKTNCFFTTAFQSYNDPKKKGKKNKTINGLYNKLLLILAVLDYSKNNESCDVICNQYFSLLKQRLDRIGYDNLKKLIDDINDWKNYRNEVTHALANKTLLDLEDKLKEISEQGIKLSKSFDNVVKKIKRDGKLRSYLKMQD